MPQISVLYMFHKVSWGAFFLVLIIYLSYRYLIPKLLELQVIRKFLSDV